MFCIFSMMRQVFRGGDEEGQIRYFFKKGGVYKNIKNTNKKGGKKKGYFGWKCQECTGKQRRQIGYDKFIDSDTICSTW